MLIDVRRPEMWGELNDKVKDLLRLPETVRCHCYQGLGHAIFEITQSTAQFMSHKKSVAFIKGQTSVLDDLLPYYYKETYQVNVLSHMQMQNVSEWVESLNKDTNFVVFSEDHPVTGELYSFAEELDELLNKKRIWSVRISHFNHLTKKSNEVRPYSVRLCSYTPDVAVALLGQRYRSPSLVAHNMNWRAEEFIQSLQNHASGHREDPLSVQKFETEMEAKANLFFPKGALRIFDRSVVYFEDINAEAVAHRLFEKLNLPPEEGWKLVSTTNMCHWSGMKMFKHWWEPAPSAEMLRGLLVIGTQALAIKDFAKLLISSYEEILQQQSWSV